MSNRKIRVIFMGTPEFALPGLKSLIAKADFEIVGVFTQPDKPVGRRQAMTPPPIKVLAMENGLPVFQPDKIKAETERIEKLAPNLIVVIAYGKIIPASILDIPKYGCLNVHASLLPKYRGAACLNAPILNGDDRTGITIMKMDVGLDTGPILRQAEIRLNGHETLEIVHDRLSGLSGEILVPTIYDWVGGKITPLAQDDSQASYIKTLTKEDGRIDWHRPAIEIERLVRAYNPWPGTYCEYQGKNLKIIAAEPEILTANGRPAGSFFLHQGNLAVQCGQDALVILKLQLEGRKAMSAADFLRGNPGFIA